jgi:hypothetical protein
MAKPKSPKIKMPIEEPGWVGRFTRARIKGALPNGTRVVKVAADPGDAHVPGALATILGSFGLPDQFGYFVEWDDAPKHAVFVMANKLKAAS